MTHQEIMDWAKQYHYPFLAIGKEDAPETREGINHGFGHYAILHVSPRRMALVAKRIQRWEAMLARERLNRAIDQVEAQIQAGRLEDAVVVDAPLPESGELAG